MTPIYATLVGIAMGFFIQRVRASSPGMIVRNLRLENLSVIKFMALTMAVGMILVYTLSLFVPSLLHWDIKPTYVLGVLLGGLVFGVGFGVGGYCPGTSVVGMGEGRKDAVVAVLGGIVGAFVFTVVYSVLIAPIVKVMDFGKITLADVTHQSPFVVALIVGALFLVVIKLLPTEVQKSR